MLTEKKKSSIPRYGWSKPTIVHIPRYQQAVVQDQAMDDPFTTSAMHDVSSQDGHQGAVSDHPTRSQWAMGRSLTPPKSSSKLDRDDVRSEWETIAGDDEPDGQMPTPPKAKVTLKSLGLVPESDDEDDDGDITRKGTKLPFNRPGTPFDAFGFSGRPAVREAHPIREDIEVNGNPYGSNTGFIKQPVYGGAVQGPPRPTAGFRNLPINSKTSSSESTDRFKYDGEAYSTFLQPSSTRETKNSLRQAAPANDERKIIMRTGAEPRGQAMPNKAAFYNPTAVRST